MYKQYKLNSPISWGAINNQISVDALELAITSINTQGYTVSQGKATVQLILEDVTSHAQILSIGISDATQLARFQAILASPIAAFAPPSAPVLSSAAGGTLAATTYYVKVTYVTGLGETLPSAEASLAVAANSVLVVTSPAQENPAIGYKVYVSTTAGQEVLQSGSTPVAIGTNWTMPTTGIVTGTASVPVTDSTGSGGVTVEEILLDIAASSGELPAGTIQ